MIHQNDPAQSGRTGDGVRHERPVIYRYWQPLLAFIVLSIACLWIIIPTHKVCMFARALGEHWYSIYNCMLAATGILLLLASRLKKKPAMAWRVWDCAICCAILSLGFKLVPLPRPDGGPHGFPSGHALTAFAAACLLMNTFPKMAPYAFTIAVAVGWSRVEIREHFVYQVIIGAIFGTIVGAAVSHAKDLEGVVLPRILRLKRRAQTTENS
jgi:membrane-associated phospholipid phosphatase